MNEQPGKKMSAMAAKHSNPEEENENQRELSTNGEY